MSELNAAISSMISTSRTKKPSMLSVPSLKWRSTRFSRAYSSDRLAAFTASSSSMNVSTWTLTLLVMCVCVCGVMQCRMLRPVVSGLISHAKFVFWDQIKRATLFELLKIHY